MAEMTNQLARIKKIVQDTHSRAKNTWSLVLTLQFAIVIAGCISVLFDLAYTWLSIVFGLGLIIASGLKWYTDYCMSRADYYLRRFEEFDLFGWKLNSIEWIDMLSETDSSIEEVTDMDAYWSSMSPPGPIRAIENVTESAWWTKELYYRLFIITTILTTISFALAAIAAIFSLASAEQVGREVAAKIVISVVSFIFSGGFIRICWEYYRGALSLRAILARAQSLLMEADKSGIDIQSVKLLKEYQLARAKSPPIPERIYHKYKDRLGRLWELARSQEKVNTDVMSS